MSKATINFEDGQIRVYLEERLSPEDFAALRSELSYLPRQRQFRGAYTPTREALIEKVLGLELGEDDTDMEEAAQDRATRFQGYAGSADQEYTERRVFINSAIDGLAGTPILIGHHSEKRHRRFLARIDANIGKSIEAADRADYWRRRAQSALRRVEQRQTAPAILRRIEELETGLRKMEKRRDDEFGKVGEISWHTDSWIWFYENRLAFERALLEQVPQEALPLTKADLEKGGAVHCYSAWYEIEKVNAKTVTITAHRSRVKVPMVSITPDKYLSPDDFAAAEKLPFYQSGGWTIEGASNE